MVGAWLTFFLFHRNAIITSISILIANESFVALLLQKNHVICSFLLVICRDLCCSCSWEFVKTRIFNSFLSEKVICHSFIELFSKDFFYYVSPDGLGQCVFAVKKIIKTPLQNIWASQISHLLDKNHTTILWFIANDEMIEQRWFLVVQTLLSNMRIEKFKNIFS